MLSSLKIGLPIQLVVIVLVALLFGNMIPESLISIAYAISLSIKEMLLFVMPFIIFSFIFSCLISFKEGSFRFLSSLLGGICLSNFVCTLIAFGVSLFALNFLHNIAFKAVEATTNLTPAWQFSLYRFISNDLALFVSIGLGILFSYFKSDKVEKLSLKLKSTAHMILGSVFIPILPLFILGFILKMQYEGALSTALVTYAPIALLFLVTQILYLAFLYAIGTDFSFAGWSRAIRNVFPAGLTALSTMSSLAALPYSLKAAKENTNNNKLVEVIIPSTVNIHLIGDSIAIPTIALAMLYSMGMQFPDLSLYIIFAFYFVINKFAVAAVPGGGILVMLPVLQLYLGFNDEMLSLITMLYILFDGIITFVNVLGNGAFAILFTKAYKQNDLDVVPKKESLLEQKEVA